jgi:hypothetical protein
VWQKANLMGIDLLILLVIARGADRDGGMWSGHLDRDLGVCVRAQRNQLKTSLRRLARNGFIKVEGNENFANIWICDPAKWVKGEQSL